MTFDNIGGQLFEIAKERLLPHVGHALEIANYRDANIAIECTDCGEVLVDFLNEPEGE